MGLGSITVAQVAEVSLGFLGLVGGVGSSGAACARKVHTGPVGAQLSLMWDKVGQDRVGGVGV